MPEHNVSNEDIERATHAVVHEAARDGTLESGDFTPRRVRKLVEEKLSLEEGTLDSAEYKAVVKAAISVAMAGVENENEVPEVEEKVYKKKSSASGKDNNTDAKQKAERKPRQTKKAIANAKEDGKGTKAKRSSSVVASNDEETKPVPKVSPKTKAKSKKVVESDEEAEDREHPRERRKNTKADPDEDAMSVDDAELITAKATKPESSKATQANASKPEVSQTSPEGDHGNKSDSETSALIDEPPKRSRKKAKDEEPKSKPKKEKEPKPRKSKEPAKELSKDEEAIKRLKSLVVACGIRKVWSKEFRDLDKPSEQIKRLKEILSDLGMTGRMSLEQARAIKEKRELAQELEDVQKFEKSVMSTSGRGRGRTQRQEELSDEESESGVKAVKRKTTARQSIMAFLGDQSDED